MRRSTSLVGGATGSFRHPEGAFVGDAGCGAARRNGRDLGECGINAALRGREVSTGGLYSPRMEAQQTVGQGRVSQDGGGGLSRCVLRNRGGAKVGQRT